jgi:N-carbamoylputrescine amidase
VKHESPPDPLTLGLVQTYASEDPRDNLDRTVALIERAADEGAGLVLLQELFRSRYFPQAEDDAQFALAESIPGPTTEALAPLAKRLGVVLVASLFEKRARGLFHNTAVVLDADGRLAGSYRKMHIPDDPRFYEKYYFTPGDLGFRVFDTRAGRIGVLVCWDQWYPEAARLAALDGAEILFYPTAIGSEPQDATIDSKDHWQRTMQGHAAANLVPLVASNRIGTEQGESCALTFYGSSFIADQTGAKVAEAPRDSRAVITATFDLDEIRAQRAAWGLFRDRRPDLYGPLLTLDGTAAET